MIVIETGFKQHDPEWYAAMVANIGATGVKSIVTSSGKRSESREKYLWTMAEESLTGVKRPFYPTYDMKVGTAREPEARSVFEGFIGETVGQCAMIYPDEKKLWHISPDLIMPWRKEGGEIKCRSLIVFEKHKKKGVLPTEDKLQIQTSLACTQWDAWWYISYFPGLAPMILRIERDESLIKIIRAEIRIFLRDLTELLTELKS